MFFGRIISASKSIDAPFYIEIAPKYVDDGVDTLIVGKKRAVELFGKENVHVLDRKIRDNVSWTYAKNERREEYENDVKKFIDSVSKKVSSSVNYYFVNIFTEKYTFIKKMIRWIDSDSAKSVFVTDRHVYIYGGKDVIGLSLVDAEYAGIRKRKILDRIKSNPANSVFDGSDFIDENLRKFVKNSNIIVPYIHFISN